MGNADMRTGTDEPASASDSLDTVSACSRPSPACEAAVKYAMAHVLAHPAWYPGLTAQSKFEDFQAHFARERSAGCKCSSEKVKALVNARKPVLEKVSPRQQTGRDRHTYESE